MRLHRFNPKIARLKLKLKQNREKYIRVGTLVFSIVIFIIGITFFAFAKFNTQDKYNVMQSTVGTFVEGDYILASYLDGTKVDTLPTKSDSISVDHIDCDNNATGTWNYTDWAIYITGATKRTKCTVYFVTQAHTGATEGDSKLGTASVDQVLSGATFSSTKGTNITGTMANNGALNWAPTSSTTYTVPAGYYSGGTLDSSASYTSGYNNGVSSATTNISSKIKYVDFSYYFYSNWNTQTVTYTCPEGTVPIAIYIKNFTKGIELYQFSNPLTINGLTMSYAIYLGNNGPTTATMTAIYYQP